MSSKKFMKRPQFFFLDSVDLKAPHAEVLNKNFIHQIERVLRMKVGDPCKLLDGKGGLCDAEILNLNSKKLSFKLSNFQEKKQKKERIHLYFGIPKKAATLEWLVQKSCELGVDTLNPLITERTQLRQLTNRSRLERIIIEAMEQSEQAFLQELRDPLSWRQFYEQKREGLLLAGDPWDFDAPLKELIASKPKEIHLVIGPEGGLSSKELSDIRELGGKIFVLGPEVLRLETAVLASLAVLQYA